MMMGAVMVCLLRVRDQSSKPGRNRAVSRGGTADGDYNVHDPVGDRRPIAARQLDPVVALAHRLVRLSGLLRQGAR